MTMTMILRRMVQIQSQTMTLKWQAHAVAAAAHPLRSSRCAGRAVGLDPLSMQLNLLTANTTTMAIISNLMIQSMTCRRCYCRRVLSNYEECGGYLDLKQLQLQLKWRQQQQQQHRQLWRHQMHHRQRRWFTLSNRQSRVTPTLQDYLTSTSCNTVTATPPLMQYMFQNHHHHQQQQQQQHHPQHHNQQQQHHQHHQQQQQRAFSSSQSASMDRNGTEERIVEDGGGRLEVDIDLTSLSIQDHLDELHTIPLENIRNFCIIAHVDHGKSSLASRILEYTGNLGRERQCTAHHLGRGSDEDDSNGGDDDTPVGDDADYNQTISGGSSLSGNENSSLLPSSMSDASSSSSPTKLKNINTDNNTKNNNDNKEEITILDTLAVERERGITVRASAASMLYRHSSSSSKSEWILLQMVDTPGHVDFGMEVGKSLDGVEGAILLIDSARGVQAQTLSVYDKAKSIGRQRRMMRTMSMNNSKTKFLSGVKEDNANAGKVSFHGDSDDSRNDEEIQAGITGDIRILPALTKVDMPSARPLEVALAVSDLLGFDPDEILKTSARTRIGIKEVLDAICERVPPPEPLPDDDGDILRAKVIDSWFESKRGVIALVRILSGKVEENDRISIIEPASYEQIADGAANAHTAQKDNFSVQEVGLMMPHRIRTGKLTRGQMGYVIAGLRDPREARPGVILSLNKSIPTLIGNGMELPPSVSMGKHSVLFASVHPIDGDGFDELFAAVSRLALSDSGLEVQQTAGSSNSSGSGGGPFLGPGLRVGFQGLLHVEVFRQRLEDEFNLEAIVTPPKVPYTIQYLPSKNYHRSSELPMEEVIEDLIDWPPQGHRFKVLEPMVDVRVLAPMEYAGNIMELIKRKRGAKMETRPIDEHAWQITSVMPWAEVVTDFHDELKSSSTGYASFDVSEADPPKQESNLCKVEIMLNNEVVDPLSFVCHVDAARSQARVVCEKLQDVLPRQQFVTVIQAKADGKIIASERIRAYRKDVLTKSGKTVGGGDITRKKKLLEKQKQGKKKTQATGKVTLSQEAFRAVISRSG